MVSCTQIVTQCFPGCQLPASPSAGDPLHCHLSGGISQSPGQGRPLRRATAMSAPRLSLCLCQTPAYQCQLFASPPFQEGPYLKVQCLPAAVPTTSRPLCALPHHLATAALSHESQCQGMQHGCSPSRWIGSRSGFRAVVRPLDLAMHILATFLWRAGGRNSISGLGWGGVGHSNAGHREGAVAEEGPSPLGATCRQQQNA